MSDSLRPHGLYPARILCPWNSPGTNTGVGNHSLLQGIFPIHGLPHWRQILFHLIHQGSPLALHKLPVATNPHQPPASVASSVQAHICSCQSPSRIIMSQNTLPPRPHSYSRHTGLPATLSPNLVIRFPNSLGLPITSISIPNSHPLHFLMATRLPWGLWGIRAPSCGYYQDRAGRELHITESEVKIKLGAHFTDPAGFRRILPFLPCCLLLTFDLYPSSLLPAPP